MTNLADNQTPRWLHIGILVLLGLVAANLLAWRTIEPDLWGHIQYGEDWLHYGEMPRTATHTYSTPDFPWINHENIFELAVALGQRWIGGSGLMVFKCLSGLWLLALMIRHARRRNVPLMGAVVAMVPVAAGLAEFWLMRPQLFSFLCFGLLMLIFESGFRDWNTAGTATGKPRALMLVLCVPLMIFWTNSHGGFLAGLCVILAILGLRGVEATWHHRRAATRTVMLFAIIGLACIGAVFVNPYGWELPWWMLVSLSQPRPEVSEWANVLDGGVTAFPFIALSILTILAVSLTKKRRDWVELIVLFLIAVQTLGHVRHLAFFALAFGFWIPEHLMSLWDRLVAWRPTLGQNEPLTAKAQRWISIELLAVAAGLAGLLGYNLWNFGVDRTKYPVDAVEFMARENIRGRAVVTFDWAQYALAALHPGTTVGFDGRYDTCYPQYVVDMNFDLLFGKDMSRRHRGKDSGPVDSNRVLEFGNPNLVLLDRTCDQPAIEHMKTRSEWTLLYQDGLTALYGRRSEFDDPSRASYFPESRRIISDRPPKGLAVWPGFPGRCGRDAFSPAVAQQVDRQMQLDSRVQVSSRKD